MSAGTVTANAYPARRIPVIRNAFVSLAGFALNRPNQDGWVHCSVCGGKSYWKHCVTCHQQGDEIDERERHGSCFGCGTCLPRRSRRWYCSTSCRVRAHNYYHQTVAGRAQLAKEELERAVWREAMKNAFGRASEQQIRMRKAARYGKTCGDCGVELNDYEPTWRRRRSHYPICRSCCPDPDGIEPWGNRKWLPALPCDGCGRPVYIQSNDRQLHRRLAAGRYVRWDVCSARCYQDVKHREQKDAAAAGREPTDCTVCGERVDARRRDARYCSSACRQKAYRGRVAS